MAKMIRATRRLRDAGIEHIEVHRVLHGFALYDPRLKRQEANVYQQIDPAVQAALEGERPKEI